jgi:hypothetical protein
LFSLLSLASLGKCVLFYRESCLDLLLLSLLFFLLTLLVYGLAVVLSGFTLLCPLIFSPIVFFLLFFTKLLLSTRYVTFFCCWHDLCSARHSYLISHTFYLA